MNWLKHEADLGQSRNHIEIYMDEKSGCEE